MFWPTSTAKSPRIEPGLASSGFVAPITCRAASIADSTLEHHRYERAGGDEADELLEERLALVLGVVLARELAGHRHLPQRRQAQALALEAGDDLAGQVAGKGIRLDEDERALHVRRSPSFG